MATPLLTSQPPRQVAFVRLVGKHDKARPEMPLWTFYLHQLSRQPWANDGHADLWVLVGSIFQALHASAAGGATPVAAQGRGEGAGAIL